MLRKLKWQTPGEPLTARYNWCQGLVPGRGPAVEKHWPAGLHDITSLKGTRVALHLVIDMRTSSITHRLTQKTKEPVIIM